MLTCFLSMTMCCTSFVSCKQQCYHILKWCSVTSVTVLPYPTGQPGQCLTERSHRSAPGGSGAGGSVVIITKKLVGGPGNKISASGGSPVKCAFGAGGGKHLPFDEIYALTHAVPQLELNRCCKQHYRTSSGLFPK